MKRSNYYTRDDKHWTTSKQASPIFDSCYMVIVHGSRYNQDLWTIWCFIGRSKTANGLMAIHEMERKAKQK